MMIADPSGNTSCSLSPLCRPEKNEQEIYEVNLPFWGNIIYAKVLSLSRKVNSDLLEPISKWLDDPDFVKRHAVTIENNAPNWAGYKRKQREWTARQRRLAAQRLRMYWQEVHSQKNYRKGINSLIPRGKQRLSPILNVMPDFLTPIVSHFSPMEQLRRDTLNLFEQARTLSITNLLPWRLLIISDLSGPKTLTDLTEYADDRQDKDSKLIHLLHLEMEGKVKLTQKKPFGEIQIERLCNGDAAITIKDKQGLEYHFDWQDISDAQRNKVIADIKDRRILCKGI
jgi:hypothetical protein